VALRGLGRSALEAWEVPRDLLLARYSAFVTGGPLPRGEVPVFVFHGPEPDTFAPSDSHGSSWTRRMPTAPSPWHSCSSPSRLCCSGHLCSAAKNRASFPPPPARLLYFANLNRYKVLRNVIE